MGSRKELQRIWSFLVPTRKLISFDLLDQREYKKKNRCIEAFLRLLVHVAVKKRISLRARDAGDKNTGFLAVG